MPGDAVGDDQLKDVIASDLASYAHLTATAPMGGPEDPWAVVDSRGAVKGDRRSSCRRRIDHAGRSVGSAEPHDDHDRRVDRAGGLRKSAWARRSRSSGGSDGLSTCRQAAAGTSVYNTAIRASRTSATSKPLTAGGCFGTPTLKGRKPRSRLTMIGPAAV
jgi:GMC oxidoreductase